MATSAGEYADGLLGEGGMPDLEQARDVGGVREFDERDLHCAGCGGGVAYRVEYNGEDVELATLDAALNVARNAIANDVERFDGWAVEQDETVNDWYVQAVRNGRRVGPTAVISGPPPRNHTRPAPGPASGLAVVEDWEQRVSFVGETPSEAFAMAADWLSRRPEIETIGDVGWHHTASGHQLRIYFRP